MSNNLIKIGADRSTLATKLTEYKSRMKDQESPETQWDTIYKIAIAQELLERGEAHAEEIEKSMQTKYKKVSVEEFQNAWEVIEDYVTTGGKNLLGGIS